MSKYAWVIDKDHIGAIGTGCDNVTGKVGPMDASPKLLHELRSNKDSGQPFKLYDDDDNLYYEGRIIGDYDGFEPLDDFGMGYSGCTYIELYENGKWSIL